MFNMRSHHLMTVTRLAKSSRRGSFPHQTTLVFLATLFALVVQSTTVFAVNLVTVESKSFAPGQTACTVGVFITNDVPIQGLVLPLELRSMSGGAYIKGPFPSAFKFGHAVGNRIDASPLGSASDSWPEAMRLNQKYAAPSESRCTGPMANSYAGTTSSVDGISPDAVVYFAVSTGDETLGEQIFVAPGGDPEGTSHASFRFIFNVDSLTGCFRIDTCCILPASHITMVDEAIDFAPLEFDRGLISVGIDNCPGSTNPNRPNAVCKDSLIIEIDNTCTATVMPAEIDNGSWDVEDGTNLFLVLDPPGPYKIGSTDVRLYVCDQGGDCSSCWSRIIVRHIGPQWVKATPDTLRLTYSGAPESDTLCASSTLASEGCGVRLRIKSDNSVVAPALYQQGSPAEIDVCIYTLIARNAPAGVYESMAIIEDWINFEYDTIHVLATISHPPDSPVEPGCDTVCGFVRYLSGEPASGVWVKAYTCDSSGERCAEIPRADTHTRIDGSFCLPTYSLARVKIRAVDSDAEVGVGVVGSPRCDGSPNYVYLVPCEDCWWWPNSGGPNYGFDIPCLSDGFVQGLGEGDSVGAIVGASIELWDSYPGGTLLATDTSDDFGHFGLGQKSGELVVRAEGFCPTVITDFACDYTPQIVTLEPLGVELPESPIFHDYYSSNATFEGVPIQPGDVIHATDSGGQVVGLTYVTVPGQYLIHVLGNVPDGEPDPVDEGTEVGEFVQLWLNCTCRVTVPVGFENFGNTMFDAAWDCRPTGICCELCEGWNMFSYNVALDDYTREGVLATIDLNYNAVRSGRCSDDGPNPVISWFSDRPVNDLTFVEPWYGYDINMTATDTLCVEGSIIPADTEIPLCEGWNYIPYYPMDSDSREHALTSIAGNYTSIYNLWCNNFDSWDITRPDGANDLFCLNPCRGYWVKLSVADTLIYPAGSYNCDEPLAKTMPWYESGQITSSPIVADFWSNADLSISGLSIGDIITVTTESGQLVGACRVREDGIFLMHVFGDVPGTALVEGAQPGEHLAFQVNGVAATVEGNATFNQYGNYQITLRVSDANPIPSDYALLQNYPNPFNAGTVISFDLKHPAAWSLTIYNIAGQTVRQFAGDDVAGRVRVQWNGRNESGNAMASGVYFYRISANQFTASRKMILVK